MLAKTDVVRGNIHGAELTVFFKKRFSTRKSESLYQSYHFAMLVMDENGKAIQAVNSSSKYDRDGTVVSESSTNDLDILQTGLGRFFIPYYALGLNEGVHKLKIKLEVARFDSVKGKFDTHKVVVLGPAEKLIQINKPKTRTLKLYCSGVRVQDHNAKGNSWDFGGPGLPDLVYRVLLESDAATDRLYSSTEMQNATSAAWINYTGPITISEGDKITIGIYDNDTLYDDLIGTKDFTFEEILAAGTAGKELHFGLVEFCTLKVQELK